MDEPAGVSSPAATDGHASVMATILVGVSPSDSSHRALEWTARFARAAGSTVLAVHVLTFNEEFSKDAMSPDTMRTWRRDREVLLKDQWLTPLIDAGITHSHRIVEADSVDAGLLACAEASKVDLVVVGAGGSGGLLSRMVDGRGSRLTHRAHQPVVVVPKAWQPTH